MLGRCLDGCHCAMSNAGCDREGKARVHVAIFMPFPPPRNSTPQILPRRKPRWIDELRHESVDPLCDPNRTSLLSAVYEELSRVDPNPAHPPRSSLLPPPSPVFRAADEFVRQPRIQIACSVMFRTVVTTRCFSVSSCDDERRIEFWVLSTQARSAHAIAHALA